MQLTGEMTRTPSATAVLLPPAGENGPPTVPTRRCSARPIPHFPEGVS